LHLRQTYSWANIFVLVEERMRRFVDVAAMSVAMACAAALPGTPAQAMGMPAGAGPAAPAAVEQVYLSCTRFWNGWRWVRRCVDAGPTYYAPPPAYGYGYGYGYGWRPRRYYGYY
jgi:hypothetical protein